MANANLPVYSNDDEPLLDNSDNNDITFNATLELPVLHDTHSDINFELYDYDDCGRAMSCTMLSQTTALTRVRILIVNTIVIDNLHVMSNPIVNVHLSISMLEA